MDYNHVMERIGEVIDGAGVAVLVIGAVIAAGTAAVRLTRHETGSAASASSSATPSCSAWNCWSLATSSAPSLPSQV